jgi:hypothetical protein
MALKITQCTKNNFCKDCTDEECLHAGKIHADCPKTQCIEQCTCEECDFIKEYYKLMQKH